MKEKQMRHLLHRQANFFAVLFVSSWFLYVPSYVARTTPVPRINFALLFFGLFSSGSSFFLIPVCKFSNLCLRRQFLFSEKFRMG